MFLFYDRVCRYRNPELEKSVVSLMLVLPGYWIYMPVCTFLICWTLAGEDPFGDMQQALHSAVKAALSQSPVSSIWGLAASRIHKALQLLYWTLHTCKALFGSGSYSVPVAVVHTFVFGGPSISSVVSWCLLAALWALAKVPVLSPSLWVLHKMGIPVGVYQSNKTRQRVNEAAAAAAKAAAAGVPQPLDTLTAQKNKKVEKQQPKRNNKQHSSSTAASRATTERPSRAGKVHQTPSACLPSSSSSSSSAAAAAMQQAGAAGSAVSGDTPTGAGGAVPSGTQATVSAAAQPKAAAVGAVDRATRRRAAAAAAASSTSKVSARAATPSRARSVAAAAGPASCSTPTAPPAEETAHLESDALSGG